MSNNQEVERCQQKNFVPQCWRKVVVSRKKQKSFKLCEETSEIWKQQTKVFFKNFLMHNSSSRVFFLQEMTVVFRERKQQKFFKKIRHAYFTMTYFLRMGKDFEG